MTTQFHPDMMLEKIIIAPLDSGNYRHHLEAEALLVRGGELVNSHSFPRDMESSLASFFIIFEQLRNGQYGRVKRGSLEKNAHKTKKQHIVLGSSNTL